MVRMVPPTLCWARVGSSGVSVLDVGQLCCDTRRSCSWPGPATSRHQPPPAELRSRSQLAGVRGPPGPARRSSAALRRSRSQIPLLCASPSPETGVCLARALAGAPLVPPGAPLVTPWHVCRCEVMVSLHSLGAMALS